MIVRGITPEEYFELEDHSDERHEYMDGVMFPRGLPICHPALVRPHNKILFNVLIALETALRGVEREICAFDTAVRTETGDVPADIVVVRGEPILDGEKSEVVLNPKAIIELSPPGSPTQDLHEKFARFYSIPSLSSYLFISQDKPFVNHVERKSNGAWLLSEIDGQGESVHIVALNCDLSMADLYDRVTFVDSDHKMDIVSGELYATGVFCQTNGEIVDATRHYVRAMLVKFNNYQAHTALGHLLEKHTELTETVADELVKNGHSLSSPEERDQASQLITDGIALCSYEQVAIALDRFRQAIAKDFFNASAHIQYGTVYVEVIHDTRRQVQAILAKFDDYEAHIALGEILTRHEELVGVVVDEMVSHGHALPTEEDKEQASLLLAEGIKLRADLIYPHALEKFRLAAETDFTNGLAHLQYGSNLRDDRYLVEDHSELQLYLHDNPDDIDALYTYANKCYHLGKDEEAKAVYMKIVQSFPSRAKGAIKMLKRRFGTITSP